MENPPPVYEMPLRFHRADFEALFFEGGKGNLFYPKEVKQSFFFAVSGFVLFGIGSFLFRQSQDWFVLMAGGLLLAVCMGFFFIRQALVIWRWRSQVKKYIDRLAGFHTLQIRLSAGSLSWVEDGTEHMTRWSDFSKAEIHPTHIRLQGADNHYIPKASLSAGDYGRLEQEIRQRFYEA